MKPMIIGAAVIVIGVLIGVLVWYFKFRKAGTSSLSLTVGDVYRWVDPTNPTVSSSITVNAGGAMTQTGEGGLIQQLKYTASGDTITITTPNKATWTATLKDPKTLVVDMGGGTSPMNFIKFTTQ
jgi:hypothetical protein